MAYSVGSVYSVEGTLPNHGKITLETIQKQIFKLNSNIAKLKKNGTNPKLVEEKEQYN
jgi:hypothetical protein